MKATLIAAVFATSAALMPVSVSAQDLEVNHSAETDVAADAQLDCFIAERANASSWTNLLVRCQRPVAQWNAACTADTNLREFCVGKSFKLAQLIYYGKLVCDATNCTLAPGYTTDVDRNGN